jgi:hypothetical protein
MKAATSNLKKLQKAGLVHPETTMSEKHKALVETLTGDEVNALISVRKKLGDDFIKKTAKGGKFPHPATISF